MPSLPIGRMLLGTLAIVADRWRELVSTLAVPLLILAGISAYRAPLQSELESNPAVVGQLLVLLILNALVSVIYTVSIHRVTLLGGSSIPNRVGLYWSMREWRFFGWMIFLAVCLVPFAMLYMLIKAANATEGTIEFGAFDSLALALAWTVVMARFGFVLPAAALGKRIRLAEVNSLIVGNFGRLFVVLLVPALTVALMSAVVTAPAAVGSPLGASISTLIFGLLGIFDSVALSVCFRYLADAHGYAVAEPVEETEDED